MFLLNPKPTLSPKELVEKVTKLKPAFDKLTNYKAKLDFWYKHNFDISIRTYGITDEQNKKDLPENNITIYPENNEEVKEYKQFYYELFTRHNFRTYDNSIDEYWRQIEQGANPIPYTRKQIADIETCYQESSKNTKTGLNTLRSYANGFEASQNGILKDFLNNSFFRENLHSYFTGVSDELYVRFLEKQLKQLESPKPQMFNVHQKLEISCRLIGENRTDTSQLVFHQIPYVIGYFKITPLEARNILFDMKGANSPDRNVKIVDKIIKHIESKYPEILIEKPQQTKIVNVKKQREIKNADLVDEILAIRKLHDLNEALTDYYKTNLSKALNLKDAEKFLNYLEYDYLASFKTRIKVDEIKYKDITHSLFTTAKFEAQEKATFLEKWIKEKRKTIDSINNAHNIITPELQKATDNLETIKIKSELLRETINKQMGLNLTKDEIYKIAFDEVFGKMEIPELTKLSGSEISTLTLDAVYKSKERITKLVKEKSEHSKDKASINNPTAPVIATFCKIVCESKIVQKNSNETNEKYCVRICEKYKIPYTDRVRQNYSGANTSKHLQLVKTLILPNIHKKDRDKINSYLGNKELPKQKLYA